MDKTGLALPHWSEDKAKAVATVERPAVWLQQVTMTRVVLGLTDGQNSLQVELLPNEVGGLAAEFAWHYENWMLKNATIR
jgi:hypothetical protein